VVAADHQQLLAARPIPPGRIVVHPAFMDVHAINDGIAKRSAALDDPSTHRADILISYRAASADFTKFEGLVAEAASFLDVVVAQ